MTAARPKSYYKPSTAPKGRVPAGRDKVLARLRELDARIVAEEADLAAAANRRERAAQWLAIRWYWGQEMHEFNPHDTVKTQCGLCWGWADDYRHLGPNESRSRRV